jgi:MFS family permease
VDRAAAAPPLWRNRDFLLLWSGQLVSFTGTQVSQLAVPLLVLALSGSPAQAGLVAAVRSAPMLIFVLPAGAWLDRWDRKRTMILCDLVRSLALASVPFCLLAPPTLILPLLAMVSLIEGALGTLFSVAQNACLPRVVGRDQISQALSANSLANQVGGMVGPWLGGVLYAASQVLPFVADAASYAVSVLSLVLVRAPFQAARTERVTTNLRYDIVEGWRWLLGQPLLRSLVGLVGGLTLCSFGDPLILVVRAQELGADARTIGLLFASGPVGGVLGALVAPLLIRRFALGPLAIVSAWVWVLTWIPYALAPSLAWLAVVNLASWINVPLFGAVPSSYRSAAVPDRMQGRVSSVYRLVTVGSQPFSLALTGLLLSSFGAVTTILLITLPQLLLVALVSFSPTVRNAPHLSAVAAAND